MVNFTTWPLHPPVGLEVGPEVGEDILERGKKKHPASHRELNPRLSSPQPSHFTDCYHNSHLQYYFSVLFLNVKDCATTQTLKSVAHHHGHLESTWDLW